MVLEVLNGVVQDPGRYKVSRGWGADEGALPSWLSLGADATDAGSSGAFTSFAGAVPGYTISGATQPGSGNSNRRRASLVGPTVDISKVEALRVRCILTGGTQQNWITRFGVSNTHATSSSPTTGFALQGANLASANFTVIQPTASAQIQSTRLRWLPSPIRHDLTFWLTADRWLYLGAGDQIDWAHRFASADLALGPAIPFISFSSNGTGIAVSLIVHRFELDLFYT